MIHLTHMGVNDEDNRRTLISYSARKTQSRICICSGHMRRIWGRSHRRVLPSKMLRWCLQVKRIVGPYVVADTPPLPHGSVQAVELQVPHVAIMKLHGVGPLGPMDVPVWLGRGWGQDEQPHSLLGTASSKSAWNSLSPSTWKAFTG